MNTTSMLVSLSLVSSLAAGGVDIFTLDFEGVGDRDVIGNYYNGGPGVNHGVSFGGNALGIVDRDAGGSGNFANEPSGDTIMFYLEGGDTVMNVADGFDTAFSFYYSSNSFAETGVNAFVTLYDGLNGTGNVLGTIQLVDNIDDVIDNGDPTGEFDTWTAIGVHFAGTVRSVDFGGAANQVGFDDVTFGRIIPAPGAVAVLATAGLVAARRRRAA